jgi:hypothetical protein
MATYTEQMEGIERPSYVAWQAVLSGAAVGLAVFFILSALWFALAGSSGTGFFGKNLAWFALGDALFSAAVAGYVGGLTMRTRGRGPGMLTGLTVWGVIMFAALLIGTPQLATVFQANTTGNAGASHLLSNSQLWATFGAFIGGFGLAGMAGAMGGESRARASHTGGAVAGERRLGRQAS